MSIVAETPPQNTPSPYTAAAQTALRHYALGPTHLHFIAHNAGVAFRIDAPQQGRSYLLKLQVRVGEGENASVPQLEKGMEWLAGIARETDIKVQIPLATLDGAWVGTVVFEGQTIPFTLQEWLEGRMINGQFNEQQMGQISSLMAKLHRYSRLSPFPLDNANQHGPEVLDRDVRILRDALDHDLLPASDFEIVSRARCKIHEVMVRLGKSREVWGPIHGDIHYDNLVLAEGNIYPIDFTELRCAHYLYDLGVTLYHTLHQGATMRQAFLQGYRQIVALPRQHLQYLDAFITFAAISNIAWNATLPEQVASALFRKNLHQLVHTFCRHLMAESSFLEADRE